MKKILTYAVIIILCACALYACNKATANPKSISVSVLWDKTDTMLSNPNSVSIKGLFDLNSNQWDGAYFSYASITDVDYNERKYSSLPPESLWSGNELERKQKVESFFDNIDSILQQSDAIKTGRLHSAIYKTVVDELIRLKSEPSTTHVLLVFSDLEENSDLYNVYDPVMLQKLLSNPNQVETLFEKSISIPDLHGMTVYFLFEPKSQCDNRIFNAMSGVYKEILNQYGATVIIQSNL